MKPASVYSLTGTFTFGQLITCWTASASDGLAMLTGTNALGIALSAASSVWLRSASFSSSKSYQSMSPSMMHSSSITFMASSKGMSPETAVSDETGEACMSASGIRWTSVGCMETPVATCLCFCCVRAVSVGVVNGWRCARTPDWFGMDLKRPDGRNRALVVR